MKILSFDPAGNFLEGKGTTGWAMYYENVLTSVGQISAQTFDSRFEYWQAHINLIEALEPDIVIIENYTLYAFTKEAQIGSELETPQLIGVLKYYLNEHEIPFHLQHAKVKNRYSNKILLHKKIISQTSENKRYYAVGIPISGHILDAIRHAEFFIQFNMENFIKERFNERSDKI